MAWNWGYIPSNKCNTMGLYALERHSRSIVTCHVLTTGCYQIVSTMVSVTEFTFLSSPHPRLLTILVQIFSRFPYICASSSQKGRLLFSIILSQMLFVHNCIHVPMCHSNYVHVCHSIFDGSLMKGEVCEALNKNHRQGLSSWYSFHSFYYYYYLKLID